MNIEQSERLKLIGFLAAAFPSANISAETFKVYVRLMDDIPFPLFTAAIQQCAQDCRFFPTIAEIRERVLILSMPIRLSPSDAWGEVVGQMKAVGWYGQPKFDDDLIERVVFAMDWQQLCSSENGVADRAHFMKMYEQLVEREKSEAKLAPAFKEMRAANERRQISGTAGADEQVERVGANGIRSSGPGKV